MQALLMHDLGENGEPGGRTHLLLEGLRFFFFFFAAWWHFGLFWAGNHTVRISFVYFSATDLFMAIHCV